jgi:ABC-2 type transport system permease protein
MKLVGKQGPNVMTALLIVFSAVLAWALYWLTLPLVLRWLEQRRELILRAVTRE